MVDVNACLEDGATACQNGNLGVVSVLLQFGADSNVKTSNGDSSYVSLSEWSQ